MKRERVDFETARLRLARYRMQGEQARARAAAHVVQVSAEALGVERVGLWLLDQRGSRLVCASSYNRSTGEHGEGEVLLAASHPTYWQALQERRAIAADDARTHEDTRELTETYLVPHGIVSMLDAPIIHEGRVVGVVCHEHVGEPRHWTQRELAFASSVADMFALVFEQAQRLELDAALQERAEERLAHEKMEALGRLASAVAHDFNNLLAAVQMTVALLAKSAPPSMRKPVEDATEMIEVGRRLTRELLAFGKGRDEEPGVAVDLREVLRRVEPIVRAGVGKRLDLAFESTAREPKVIAPGAQLEQVVLNLTLNARDAIDGGGRIRVRVRDALPEDDLAFDRVVLEVSDTGVGMSPEMAEHIFEPYFTTKQSGTGLGLATVYGIVRRLGGAVNAISAPGQGTTIRVALPRAVAP